MISVKAAICAQMWLILIACLHTTTYAGTLRFPNNTNNVLFVIDPRYTQYHAQFGDTWDVVLEISVALITHFGDVVSAGSLEIDVATSASQFHALTPIYTIRGIGSSLVGISGHFSESDGFSDSRIVVISSGATHESSSVLRDVAAHFARRDAQLFLVLLPPTSQNPNQKERLQVLAPAELTLKSSRLQNITGAQLGTSLLEAFIIADTIMTTVNITNQPTTLTSTAFSTSTSNPSSPTNSTLADITVPPVITSSHTFKLETTTSTETTVNKDNNVTNPPVAALSSSSTTSTVLIIFIVILLITGFITAAIHETLIIYACIRKALFNQGRMDACRYQFYNISSSASIEEAPTPSSSKSPQLSHKVAQTDTNDLLPSKPKPTFTHRTDRHSTASAPHIINAPQPRKSHHVYVAPSPTTGRRSTTFTAPPRRETRRSTHIYEDADTYLPPIRYKEKEWYELERLQQSAKPPPPLPQALRQPLIEANTKDPQYLEVGAQGSSHSSNYDSLFRVYNTSSKLKQQREPNPIPQVGRHLPRPSRHSYLPPAVASHIYEGDTAIPPKPAGRQASDDSIWFDPDPRYHQRQANAMSPVGETSETSFRYDAGFVDHREYASVATVSSSSQPHLV